MSEIKFGLDLDINNSLYQTYKDCIDSQLPACQLSIGRIVNLFDLVKSKKLLESTPNFYTCFHGNITYNLAGSSKGSSDPQFGRKLNNCKIGLLRELDIATFLNKGVIVHIGTQEDEDIGIQQIINTINEVLILENSDTVSYARHSQCDIKDFTNRRRIILENSAGKGNQLGTSFDQISFILSQINPMLRHNVSVCIDTCHINDAGQYKLGKISEVHRFFKEFDEKINLSKLEVFHLNDSLNKFGSKMDRHAHLGRGYIFSENGNDEESDGLNGLKTLLCKNNAYDLPMIGEFSDRLGQQDIDLIKTILRSSCAIRSHTKNPVKSFITDSSINNCSNLSLSNSTALFN